ncbi:hypothetical protein LRAMOSA07903 [Lichtheimia ramosa]|uniref:Major facilitator superfamily (MFS) profile domain-containing protein n=1 Tax=Lichtheimia ramosa TaxID=688394 RepID=A0A077WDZ7_9FUNG|nr:hypothetical protein LRAMOSA07903 [Lichtheimia ramosa]
MLLSHQGIILPSIKAHYQVTQSIVSIVFLCYASGFAIAALLNGFIVKRYRQSRAVVIGGIALTLGYGLVLPALPFPALCASYVFIGFGVALVQSGANVYVGELPDSTMMLNFLHASFGLGALVGPFVASAVLSRWTWNTTYMILCGLAAINALTTLVTFRHVRIADERHLDLHHLDLERTAVDMHDSDSASTASSHTFVEDKNVLWSSIRQRVAHVGAVYLLFYVGIEVTLGNWAYTFLINERSSDNDAMSHIMSGYWAGLCMGRIALGYITLRFGEKRMVYIYISVLISMLVVFWLVPNVPINATALVISGIALGPLFPTLLSIARQCVPCRLYAATVGFLSAFGSAGSAFFPFLTGVLIANAGVTAIPPFTMAMACTIMVGWIFIPNPNKPSKT